METFPILARSMRGGLTNNRHFGAIAVAAPDGRLIAAQGDPETPAFLRSSAKPFQAMPLLMRGGRQTFALDDADVALICASHIGAPDHTAGVQRLLELGGFRADDLQCGVHPPMVQNSASAGTGTAVEPSVLSNNCSGNHAGFLLACRLNQLDSQTYLQSDHALQREVAETMTAFSSVAAADLEIAIDGCGAPTFRLPLRAAATAFARLIDPAGAAATAPYESAAAVAVEAMAAAPEMVAGSGRFTTELIRATGGRIIGKEGADGYYAVAIRGPVALGVALKLVDGGETCRDSVVLATLRQLGVLGAEEFGRLGQFFEPEIKSHGGQRTGAIETAIDLVERSRVEELHAS